MRILQLFNQYRSRFNGEQEVVGQIERLLADDGHTVETWQRSSQDIEATLAGKATAFSKMVWSREAAGAMSAKIDAFAPDVIHVHNLYPLFSPSVLKSAADRGVPVVMSLHNQALTCPKADHLRNGSICEKCFGGREWNCVTHNCRGSIVESIGYAVRSAAASRGGWFRDRVDRFLAMTEFARERLIRAGYPTEKLAVLPNSVRLPEQTATPTEGEYLAFAGRLSEEKGLRVLVAAAAQCPDVPIHLAGDGPLAAELREHAGRNVVFRGRLSHDEMDEFYARARAVVLPSTCFEMCPLTILEAMAGGLPVIASQTGGLGELVDHDSTGLLVTRGEAAPLASAMQRLWTDDAAAASMGQAGRIKAEAEYTERVFLDRLLGHYDEVIGSGRPSAHEPTATSGRALVAV